MDKATFLDRIRTRLGDQPRTQVAIPDDWAVDVDDPVARFERELTQVGGRFHHASDARTLVSIAPGVQHPTVLVTRENDVPQDVAEWVEAAGGTVLWWPDAGRREVASADLGITAASWGVAETGTIVVSSRPPAGRVPSLLPPVHIAFLRQERILPTTAELFRHVGSITEGASNVVLITGPSKSADIGLELTRGVHGPAELHVVVTAAKPDG